MSWIVAYGLIGVGVMLGALVHEAHGRLTLRDGLELLVAGALWPVELLFWAAYVRGWTWPRRAQDIARRLVLGRCLHCGGDGWREKGVGHASKCPNAAPKATP